MRLLLDSHAFVWLLAGSSKLSAPARRAIEAGADRLHLSYASVWELTIKRTLTRLDLPEAPEAMAGRAGLSLLPITLPHISRTASLPRYHGDPFDRMLVAQAIEEGLVLVTADAAIRRYPVAWLW